MCKERKKEKRGRIEREKKNILSSIEKKTESTFEENKRK